MKTKIIAAFLAALMLMLCLASCQLSELGKKDDGEKESGPVDFTQLKLSNYLKLGDYKGIEASAKYDAVTDEEYAEAVEQLLEECSEYEQITDRPAAWEDTVHIDFKGFMDGVQFEGGTAEGYDLELSENSGFIDGFAEGLVGAIPGEMTSIEVTFPDPYKNNTDLSGKDAIFEVTVHYILGELVKPELTVEFITEITDGEYTDLAAFEAFYRQTITESRAAEAKSVAMDEIWKIVTERCEVKKLPEQQVEYYFNMLKENYQSYAAQYGMDYLSFLQLMGMTEDSMRQTAEEYTADDLILYSIADKEGISVSEQEYTDAVKMYAEQEGVSVEEFEEYVGRDRLMLTLLAQKVHDRVYELASIEQ